jgi:excisionase family DNA binding protein
MISGRESSVASQEEFDPIAYIEQAFTVDKKEKDQPADEFDFDLPSIGEFLNGSTVPQNGVATTEKPKAQVAPKRKTTKRTQLSAPRPRKIRNVADQAPALDPQLHDVWTRLPKNIEFLSTFFDDDVTSNYYTGEFKETRQDLIKRLLDPELTLEEVSRLLGVCPATVRRYTNRGWLEHHRTQGGQRRFRLTNVVNFVEAHGRPTEE